MIIFKYFLFIILLSIIISSCEEVINIDLNSSKPELVVEAIISKDSLSLVRLTRTSSYFSVGEPDLVDDAIVKISNGISLEELTYIGNGYYTGSSIRGVEERNYDIEIKYKGTVYKGSSYMPKKADIISCRFFKDDSPSVLNPNGNTVFSIAIEFMDNPDLGNYYMAFFIADGKMIEKRYFLLTEHSANGGSFYNNNDTIRFEESIFYDGGTVDVQLFSIDKSIYNYFMQLDDVLFWKRRAMPPTPYNPVSNINNGVLGYFAAWAYDSKRLILE